jgi:hypothetical protein
LPGSPWYRTSPVGSIWRRKYPRARASTSVRPVSRATGSRTSMIIAGVNTLSSVVGLSNTGPAVTGVFQ